MAEDKKPRDSEVMCFGFITEKRKDWEDYQYYYRKRQHFQLCASDSNPPLIVENNTSEWAA